MFPSTSSRKTSGLSGKQRYLFPSGSDITAVTTNTRPQRVFHWVQTCGDVHENSGFNREKKPSRARVSGNGRKCIVYNNCCSTSKIFRMYVCLRCRGFKSQTYKFSYTQRKFFPSQKTHARSLVYRIYQHSIILYLVIGNKMQTT